MTITTVSEKYEISMDTLRYYEKVGLIPKVNRSKKGSRDYTPEDIELIIFVKAMREAGLGISILTEYAKLYMSKDENFKEIGNFLSIQRQQLNMQREVLNNSIEILDNKIKIFQNAEITGVLLQSSKEEEKTDAPVMSWLD